MSIRRISPSHLGSHWKFLKLVRRTEHCRSKSDWVVTAPERLMRVASVYFIKRDKDFQILSVVHSSSWGVIVPKVRASNSPRKSRCSSADKPMNTATLCLTEHLSAESQMQQCGKGFRMLAQIGLTGKIWDRMPNKLPDVLSSGLDGVLCGTAAGDLSAERGCYDAGPDYKFWQTLAEIGLTPSRLLPERFRDLLRYKIIRGTFPISRPA
jgi:hypothetical protein